MSILQKTLLLAGTITIFLGILILFTTTFSAAEEETQITVSNLEFYWNGEPVTHISYNNPLSVFLRFEYTAQVGIEINNVIVDASDINNDLSRTASFNNIQPTCISTENTYECDITNLIIQHNKHEFKIKITFTTNGETITKELEHSFQVDNSNPTLTFIGTDKCHEGTCYYASGKENTIVLEIEDEGAGLERRYVFFQIDNNVHPISFCEGGTCYGTSRRTCTDGTSVRIYFQEGHNDAGIPIQSGLEGGSFASSLRCDATPPRVDSVKAESATGLDIMTLEDEIIITANITERTSPKVEMKIIGENIGADNVTVECNPAERTNEYRCTGRITPGIDTPGEYEIPLEFTDLAGNTNKTEIIVMLYDVDRDAPADLWDVRRVTPSSSRISVDSLIFARDMYAEIELNPRVGNTQLVSVTEGTRCTPTTEDRTGNEGDVRNLRVVHVDKDTNKVFVKFSLTEYGSSGNGRYDGMSRLSYECPLRILSSRGDVFYSVPEQENFTLEIRLEEGRSLGSYVQSEAEATSKKIDNYETFIRNYNRFNMVFGEICRNLATVNRGASAMGGAGSVMSAAGEFTRPFDGGSLYQIGTRTVDGSETVKEGAEKVERFVSPACIALSCDRGAYFGAGDFMDDFVSDIPHVGSAVDGMLHVMGHEQLSDALNPWNSEIVAVTSLCLPAINHHVTARASIECAYQECLTKGVGYMGESVHTCQAQRSYAHCTRTYDSIFNAIPLTAFYTDMSNRLEELFSDPAQLGSFGFALACKAARHPTLRGACLLSEGLQSAAELSNLYNEIKNYQVFQHHELPEQCSLVRESVDPEEYYWQLGFLGEGGEAVADPEQGINQYELSNGRVVECKGTGCWVPSNTEGRYVHFDFSQAFELDRGSLMFDDVNPIVNPDNFLISYRDCGDCPEVQQGSLRRIPSPRIQSIFDENLGDEFKLWEVYDISIEQAGDVLEEYKNSFNDPANGERMFANHLRQAQLDANKGQLRTQMNLEAEWYDNTHRLKQIDDELKEIAQRRTGEDDPTLSRSEARKVERLWEEQEELEKRNEEIESEYKGLTDKDIGDEVGEERPVSGDEEDEELEDERKQVNRDERYLEMYGSWTATFNTAWRNVISVRALRAQFGLDFWTDKHIPVLSDIADVISHDFADAYCSPRLRHDSVPGSGSVALNAYGPGGFVSGASIFARRSAEVSVPGEDSYYDYWVSGGVASHKADGLSFRVKGIGRNVDVDLTEELFGEREVTVGSSGVLFGGRDTRQFTHENLFNEICIDFGMRTSDLEEYFDVVKGVRNGMLCSGVVVEGGR